ncbi:MAG: ABC transporter substrate-binding protein [Puniceicoccales bacterium]|jgi:NitT/TauT family transport system substrate-binding protein|nr:ABC transporter substrate-binding protein [Puniceicoccales bacterium]
MKLHFLRLTCAAKALLAFAVFGIIAQPSESAAAELKKLTIAHTGSSCDAPLFVAKDKGFFAAEGLDVELVLGDWSFIKEGLAFGRIAATQGLVMNYIKPIEQGLDAKFTGGIHRGCLQILAPKNSPIQKASDLIGKRIGVPALGSSPWVFASRVIGDNGGDIKRDVEWKPFPQAELKIALQKGEVDAIAIADPIAEILLSEGGVKSIVNQSTDAPYKDEYCCVVVIGGKLIRQDPKTAAGITRAILKAALWIKTNPQAAAEVAVGGKHVGGSVEVNSRVLHKLDYVPSVEGGRHAAHTAATALQRIKIVGKSTDIEKLTGRLFTTLPGVSDAWLKTLTVERVGEAAPRPAQSSTANDSKTAELKKVTTCCADAPNA